MDLDKRTIRQLTREARRELDRDVDQAFGGHACFAAEYVLLKHMRLLDSQRHTFTWPSKEDCKRIVREIADAVDATLQDA